MFPTVVEQLAQTELPRERARHRREAVRARPRLGAGAERHAARGLPGAQRSSASITTSARRRCRTSCTSASPTRSSSRSGTATTSRTCRSPWPRASASKGRGKFYEETGVIRDVIQNHLLQVVSYLAMEAPSSTYAEAIRDEQAKVLRTCGRMSADRHGARAVPRLSRRAGRGDGLARGDLRGAAAARRFLALGRACPSTCAPASACQMTTTEVIVELKNPPQVVFNEPPPRVGNYVRFRLSPQVVIAIGARAKRPGERMTGAARGAVGRGAAGAGAERRMDAYERLLGDAMAGDATLFARQDVVEAAWAIVDPVLQGRSLRSPYEPGSWGPQQADRLVEEIGGWNAPRDAPTS